MRTRFTFELVPAIYTMEIFEFQDGDLTYQHTDSDGAIVPMGISVAKLQQQLGGDEGDFSGLSGETYHISLAPWKGKDYEKTMLQLIFYSTPLFPVDIAPELRPTPFSLPSKQPQQEISSPAASPVGNAVSSASSTSQNSPSPRAPSRFDFISCSDVRREHRLKIQQSRNPEAGITVEDLLNRPEVALEEISCPVCDAPIRFSEPLSNRLQQGIEWWSNEAKVQLIFEHPVDIEEIRPVAANSPFVVHRYRRYTPVSLPPRSKDPDVELSIAQKTHDHLIRVTAEVGETTAQTLLALPEAQQSELVCPLCNEKLPVKEPFGNYIRILADDAEGDTTHIQWSISHPSDQPETKVPSQENGIYATRHPGDDELVQKRYEDYAGFVVRKRIQQ